MQEYQQSLEQDEDYYDWVRELEEELSTESDDPDEKFRDFGFGQDGDW